MSERRARPHHRTVDRVVELLGAATTDPRGLPLTRLARVVGAPVSSVQKLVYGLVACGMLDERDGRYVVGPAASVLAHRSGQPAITSPSREDLTRLHERTGAAALLVVRLGDHAVNVGSVGLSDSEAYADVARWRHPLHVTAGGRVLAAHLPERVRREWIADLLPEDPGAAMALLDELQGIRERGVATGPSGPLRPDLDSVAVPLWRDGAVVAAVALAQPREGGRALRELEQVLREAAWTG